MIAAIETTGVGCSVALFETNAQEGAARERIGQRSGRYVAAELTSRVPRSHDRVLADLFAQTLAVAEVGVADLEGLAVSVGPGSYTGIRIGMSFAIGVALGGDVPLIPVPTLDAVAWNARSVADLSGRSRVLATLPDGRGDVYAALYNLQPEFRRLTHPRHVPAADLDGMLDENVVVAGPGAHLLATAPTAVAEALGHLEAGMIAERGFELYRRGICTDAASIRPLYVAPFVSGDGRVADHPIGS